MLDVLLSNGNSRGVTAGAQGGWIRRGADVHCAGADGSRGGTHAMGVLMPTFANTNAPSTPIRTIKDALYSVPL
jgi:hypothetical protein